MPNDAPPSRGGAIYSRISGALAIVAALLVPGQAGTSLLGNSESLTVQDMTAQAGIARVTNDNMGNSLALDYNNDGISDLLLSNHLVAPAELFRGQADGTFVKIQEFATADRHYCASADFNQDNLPDIYCSIGADKGTSSTKSNELWMQGFDGIFVSVPLAQGASDSTGRGRDVTTFDANRDGWADVFLGNDFPIEYPSQNRLFMNESGTELRDTSFTSQPGSGGICVNVADFNGDGWEDVFVCGRPNRLFVSRGGRSFVNKAQLLGLPKHHSFDGQWGDMDGDGKLDLVTVTSTQLLVSLWKGTGFVPAYQRTLQAGRNIALGDLDRDGALDVYVVQGRVKNAQGWLAGPNIPDLLLLADGSGFNFVEFDGLPQVTAGGGNEVTYLADYPAGPALLITNGGDGTYKLTGPRQLLVFGRGSLAQ